MDEIRLPDFFIVGAPKCGTEAMRHYLSQHPEIHMPEQELHYFGSDLEFDRAPLDFDRYAAHFAGTDARIVGEKSVLYLYSHKAAAEIHALCPDAKIVVMLRNPVDMMLSLHGYSLWKGNETIPDFADALAAEAARDAGRVPAPQSRFRYSYRYRQLSDYAPQVERYVDTFGREAVLIVIQEHFAADSPGSYRSVLEFLGVDPSFVPKLGKVNAAREPRSPGLAALMSRAGRWLVRDLNLRALPAGLKRPLAKLNMLLLRANSRAADPAPIDPALRVRLVEEFAGQTAAIEAIIGRSLPEWRR